MSGEKSSSALRSSGHSTSSITRSLWLLFNFTRTDIKTIVVPQTFFGVATALSGYPLAAPSPSQAPSTRNIFFQIPAVVFWLWINLLTFTLANQRLPSSIIEDTHNKPWRNIPSKYVTPDSTRRLLAATICVSWVLSSWWNVWNEFAALEVLVWIYNDLGGAEEHFLVRNFLNAGGYICFGLGALKLAISGGGGSGSGGGVVVSQGLLSQGDDLAGSQVVAAALGSGAVTWTLLTGLAIATTIQVQDLQDQTGDRARSRQTFPLVWGDRVCRWSVACTVIFWSIAFPAYWDMAVPGYVLALLFGSIVATRVLVSGYKGWGECEERAKYDQTTFATWCIWLAVLYLLPLVKSKEMQMGAWFHSFQAVSG